MKTSKCLGIKLGTKPSKLRETFLSLMVDIKCLCLHRVACSAVSEKHTEHQRVCLLAHVNWVKKLNVVYE